MGTGVNFLKVIQGVCLKILAKLAVSGGFAGHFLVKST